MNLWRPVANQIILPVANQIILPVAMRRVGMTLKKRRRIYPKISVKSCQQQRKLPPPPPKNHLISDAATRGA